MTTKPAAKSAPRMKALRQKRAADGLREVRGIWADPKDHAAIKRQAKERQK